MLHRHDEIGGVTVTDATVRDDMSALRPPSNDSIVRFPASERPILLVVVDTEEEFDWSKPFDRAHTGVTHMRAIGAFQSLCDEFGVKPVYVIDFPIAMQRDAFEPLRAIHALGRSEIGAHLHPWVSPPFDEVVDARNSYPGNLPRELERAKLAELVRAIETNLGVMPRSYKAGRYGFGPNTAGILAELGFECDLSFEPAFNLTGDGGPDYTRFPAEPSWIDERKKLLSIPTTGAFVGWAASPGSYQLGQSLRALRVPGILSRLHVVEQLLLSPEGYSFEDNVRITRALLARGLRTFTFALHSPSIAAGHTPYVKTEQDREKLFTSIRRYLEFFLGELRGVNLTAGGLYQLLASNSDTPA